MVGLAGVAGVAGTGVALARSERRRRALEPDDVRARLHDRLARLDADPVAQRDTGSAQRMRRRSVLAQTVRSWRGGTVKRWSRRRG